MKKPLYSFLLPLFLLNINLFCQSEPVAMINCKNNECEFKIKQAFELSTNEFLPLFVCSNFPKNTPVNVACSGRISPSSNLDDWWWEFWLVSSTGKHEGPGGWTSRVPVNWSNKIEVHGQITTYTQNDGKIAIGIQVYRSEGKTQNGLSNSKMRFDSDFNFKVTPIISKVEDGK